MTNQPLLPPYPERMSVATFGMGCFWCSEGLFYKKKGVYATIVGFSQGETPNPTYEEVCSGRTNHSEVVRIVFDPAEIKYQELLKEFWERHDPTAVNRQGNDVGTQYRSGIYYHDDTQRDLALESKQLYALAMQGKQHLGSIATEIEPVRNFYPAEEYHQQYELKPGARQYNGLRPTGCALPPDFWKK